MMLRLWAGFFLPLAFYAAPAAAQVGEDLAVETQIPQDYDRGRNVGVEDTPRPDYMALGRRIGGLILHSRVESGAGGTSNTYLGDEGAVASPFLFVRPSARLVSDWSRHRLQLAGTTTLRNYLGEARRNERVWSLEASGELDLRQSLTLRAEADASRAFENRFSGEVNSTVAALSRYRQDFASLKATYTRGRGRAFLLADYTDLRFRRIPLVGGGGIDQSDRDRGIARLTGQLEYARSPSLSLFGQLSASQVRYDRGTLLTGEPNLDSKALRLLVGANVDIAGRVRGTIGIGYGIRDYHAAAYDTVRGLSIESRIEVFPTRRLTVSTSGQRTIEDARLSRNSFWDTRFRMQVDYEVLRNLIVNASAGYARQSYLRSSLKGDVYSASAGGRYLVSRRVQLRGSLSYNRRSSSDVQVLRNVDEARAEVGVSYQL